jgi:hypothetical protein
LLFPITGSAQSVSGVTGVVSDSTGAVIPGVTVTLTDTKTAKELTTKSNDQGVYSFTNVPPGSGYKLTFAQPGFQTLAVNEVALGVNRTESYNASLTPGEVSVTVEVTSSSDVTLNTTDASIGNIITTRQLRELPIQIRNSPASLAGLQPGVVGNNVGATGSNRVGSVTGGRTDQGNITIDGIDANDQATGQAFATVGNAPIDSLQEFRAVSANPSSAEGRSSGGQIQMVTASGTNDFHGSLRLYNRTEATAANSFFNNRLGRYTATDDDVIAGRATAGEERARRPHLVRNQFGGSLGGRIIKDKLFFFFDYEGRRDAQGVTYTRIVPLAHFRAGQVGYINNGPGCGPASRINTQPGCISVLSPAQMTGLDPAGIGINSALATFNTGRYPLPNDLTLGDGINTAGFRFNAPSNRTDNTYTTRVDWNLADNHRIFGRFTLARRNQTDTINSVAQQFQGDPESALIIQKDYGVAFGHTWVINSSLNNNITVGNTHSGLDFQSPFAPAFPNEFTFVPVNNPFAGIDSQGRIVDTPTIRDDATWTIGNHTLQFGAQIKPIRSQSSLVNDFNFVTVGLGGNLSALDPAVRPANIFNDPGFVHPSYDSAFAFALGRLASINTNFNYDASGTPFAPGTGKSRDYRYNEYEFYVQDGWKITSDLNVYAGVRYQYYQPPYEANGFQAGNDIDFQELLDIRIANAAAGISGLGAEPLLSYDIIGPKNGKRNLYKSDFNNFGPRAGFSWNPSFKEGFLGKLFGDRKTVLRGGYSLVYDRVGGAVTFIQDQVTYLFDGSAALTFGDDFDPIQSLIDDPRFTGIGSLPVNNTAPVITRPFLPFTIGGVPDVDQAGQVNYTIAQDFQIPFSHQWSIGFQRELPGDMLIDVSYVGRLGKKLFSQADAAQTTNFRDPVSGAYLKDAFNQLQRDVINNGCNAGPVTPQPWFNNQMGFVNGAQSLANSAGFRRLICIGDVSDVIVNLYFNGLLDYNVGVSSQFGTNAYITNLANSEYNGALFSLQKRFSQGLQFDFNYTWAHSIDNQSTVTNTTFGGLLCDVTDLDACRGPSDFDFRHLVNANFIYELPFGKGRTFGKNLPGWLDQVVGGFTLSGIYTYRSGIPYSTTTGSFPVSFLVDSPATLVANSSSGALAGGIHDAPDGSIQFYTDPNAAKAQFRNPVGFESGNRNVLRSGSYWGMDLALLKNFRLPWEGQRLQIRAEAYNVFNHNVFGIPNGNFASANFGQITNSVSTPREMQFAIRYEF